MGKEDEQELRGQHVLSGLAQGSRYLLCGELSRAVSLDAARLIGFNVHIDTAHPAELHKVLGDRHCTMIASESSGLPILIRHSDLSNSSIQDKNKE